MGDDVFYFLLELSAYILSAYMLCRCVHVYVERNENFLIC